MPKLKEIKKEQALLDMEDISRKAKEREEAGKGYTEEERKQIDAFYESMIKRQLRPRIQEVTHYMDFTNKKLDDIYEDIKNKKSGLSNLNRSFLTSFERSYINSLFDKKYL